MNLSENLCFLSSVYSETLILSSKKKRNEENNLHKKEKKHKGKKTLWAHCDLAYREKGKEKSIIAAGPLRVAAVIAGIWTQSLRYTASQSGASSMQTVYYHHSFT